MKGERVSEERKIGPVRHVTLDPGEIEAVKDLFILTEPRLKPIDEFKREYMGSFVNATHTNSTGDPQAIHNLAHDPRLRKSSFLKALEHIE